MKIIDFMIMLYGLDSVMQEYQNRFGTIIWSPIITVDFATIILDNIIIIHEAIRQPDNVTINENNKELSTSALSMSAFNNSQITTPRPPSISSQPSLEVDDYNDY
jgi:predicted transcriptional regulator